MSPEDRRAAYASDVTYCTNKQLVFDYLKDRLVIGKGREGRLRMELADLYGEDREKDKRLLRGLCFAIVDEADSVLVDEARTPLIISRQRDDKEQADQFHQALNVAGQLQPDKDYLLHVQERSIDLTEDGKQKIREMLQFYGGLWARSKQREDYIRQALSALHLFKKDSHYLVMDGKVQIVDEYTGRLMPDRSWEQGLHQMIEAKEGCEISTQPETMARISYQKFFRRYLRLSGMTGTASEISGELWSVYNLKTVTIPTHKPQKRADYGGRVFHSADAKWQAVVGRIEEMRNYGRPVLVGTRSVAASEHLSALLSSAAIPHKVLNARQDKQEAEIISDAGKGGYVTVATNMAGRGTDIRLGEGVSERGGLHVIATERHEAKRIDRQLFGRCGRQGDSGSYEYIVSLADELVTGFYPNGLLSLFNNANSRMGMLNLIPVNLLVVLAQWGAEYRHSHIRRTLLKVDEQLGNILAFSGKAE